MVIIFFSSVCAFSPLPTCLAVNKLLCEASQHSKLQFLLLASCLPSLQLQDLEMDLAISAVTGELVSRFISLLAHRYHKSRESSEEKQIERLQQLLPRAHMVVEEADGRYITNSGMLAQLKVLADAMYRGYWALGASKYMSLELEETPMEEEEKVSNSSALKRFRTVHGRARNKNKAWHLLELRGASEILENVLANMTEFLVILGGCDHVMPRRPYDVYLYNDNIMFGRHAEKQKLLNFMLLQHDSPTGDGDLPAVLPIIGGRLVGKRTLVAHVCKDDRVRAHFSSILRLNGDISLSGIADLGSSLLSGKKILIIVELYSDVSKENWAKFYSSVASLGRGSKVIILSRHRNSELLGTVKPILLSALSYEEFSYLFKTLAFGSASPAEHPRLAKIADEFAEELHSEWDLSKTNMFADVLQRKLDFRFWLGMLSRLRRVVRRNVSLFGEHPRLLIRTPHQLDFSDVVLYPAAPLGLVCCCIPGSSRTELVAARKELPKVALGDLLVDPGVRPRGEFNVLTWESRLPPYTSFVHFVPDCAPDVAQDSPWLGRKRRGIPL